MEIAFWGAVGTTTGSMHLLKAAGKSVLLDCGLYQGRREESRQRNEIFPFDPASVDSVALSHAHIDHCGNLPNFARRGFKQSIFCTHATRDLSAALLMDSAHIQEKDIRFVNKRRRAGEPLAEPLYTQRDAIAVAPQFVGVAYEKTLHLVQGIRATFRDAGHILGSASILVDATEDGQTRRIAFSGDIGRKNLPVLRDPQFPDAADYLIMESTYGARLHDPPGQAEDALAEVVLRTIARGGKIIIPAFSVGRTQEIVYALKRLRMSNRLPAIPMFVDSPLAVNVTEIFRRHYECYDEETLGLLLSEGDPFGFEALVYVRDVEQSKSLNARKGPMIIIASSGMCEAGRILHHLSNSVGDPANTVLIVGFQAEHTLGRRLVEKRHEVRIFGEPHIVRAEVKTLNSYSGHADANELVEYAHEVAKRGPLKRIFLVHGEPDQSAPLAARLREELKIDVVLPERGQAYPLV